MRQFKKWLIALGAAFLLCQSSCGSSYLASRDAKQEASEEKTDDSAGSGHGSEEKASPDEDADSPSGVPEGGSVSGSSDGLAKDEGIYVQIVGAVNVPGVYHLPEGARMYELIEMAGGLRDDADITSINQAAKLEDGQMIAVKTPEDAAAAAAAKQADARVNINTADADQLMTLSGIGESKAWAIIQYREAHGPFTKCEDIMNIPGIKEAAFAKIRDKITVN